MSGFQWKSVAIDEVGYSSCQFDRLSPGMKVGLIVDMTSNTFVPQQNARHTSKFSGRYRHYHKTSSESLSRPAIFNTSSGSGVGVLDIAHTNFMRRPHPRLIRTLKLYFSEKLARVSGCAACADHAHVFRSQLIGIDLLRVGRFIASALGLVNPISINLCRTRGGFKRKPSAIESHFSSPLPPNWACNLRTLPIQVTHDGCHIQHT